MGANAIKVLFRPALADRKKEHYGEETKATIQRDNPLGNPEHSQGPRQRFLGTCFFIGKTKPQEKEHSVATVVNDEATPLLSGFISAEQGRTAASSS